MRIGSLPPAAFSSRQLGSGVDTRSDAPGRSGSACCAVGSGVGVTVRSEEELSLSVTAVGGVGTASGVAGRWVGMGCFEGVSLCGERRFVKLAWALSLARDLRSATDLRRKLLRKALRRRSLRAMVPWVGVRRVGVRDGEVEVVRWFVCVVCLTGRRGVWGW